MMSETTHSNSCECDSNAYTGLVRDIFRVCAYSPIEYVGFLSGLCSIAFWIVCQFPQMLQNYQLKTSEGLSGYFLLLWAFGDSCNLVACVLTGDQTPVQMYTAVYFLMSDSVLISQFVLYRKRQIQREERQTRRRRRLSFNESIIREEEESPEDANENAVISATMARIDENISTARSYEEESRNDPTTPKRTTKKHKKKKKPVSPSTYVTGFLGAGVSVYSIRSLSGSDAMRSLSGATRSLQSATGCLNQAVSTASEARVTSGRFIGYASATSYLGGRMFQIMKNRKRKSCEGVSALMFFFAISANVTYGMSIIFMKNFRWVEIVDSLSFLLGSLGTCVLDLYILKQSRYYRALGTDASATTAPVDRTSSLIENDWLEREASVHLLSQEAVEDL